MQNSILNFLVVDDCDVTRALHSGVLNILGHTVEEADDGRNALRKLLRHRFDCLVTDNRMPRLGGVELVKRVKRFFGPSYLPIFIVSSDDPVSIRKALGDLGQIEVLQKPMSKRKFENIIDATYRFRHEFSK